MAAMSAAERVRAARILAREIFVKPKATANLTHADLLAALGAIDDAMEGLPGALPNQAQSVANNLNLSLPEPFKGTASVAQKSTLLAIWASVKYGFL